MYWVLYVGPNENKHTFYYDKEDVYTLKKKKQAHTYNFKK
jgi:hypothetical protein